MKVTFDLEEAIEQKYLIYSPKYKLYNQYWDSCKERLVPFVVIRWNTGNKFAYVILDMLPAAHNLSPNAVNEIVELFTSLPIKENEFYYGPERIAGPVLAEKAEELAQKICDIAFLGIYGDKSPG